MKQSNIIVILTFFGLFIYFYKTSRKFRKSIYAAFMVSFIVISGPLESQGNNADAFTPQQKNSRQQRNKGLFNNSSKKPSNNGNGNGKPNKGSDSSGEPNSGEGKINGIPKKPNVESVEETRDILENIKMWTSKMEESSDSESEEEEDLVHEQNKRGVQDPLAILEETYGSNFVPVENGEFKIQDWQAAKKIYHAVCFGLKPEDFGFSQKEVIEIELNGGLVEYVRNGKNLPSLDFIRAFQKTIKKFCEDRKRSDRNDYSTFYGTNSITFFNQETRQVVIFNRETKIFITAYKLSSTRATDYRESGNIGRSKKN